MRLSLPFGLTAAAMALSFYLTTKIEANCEPYLISGTVVGKRCLNANPDPGVDMDESFDIFPEYVIAFLMTEDGDSFPTGDIFKAKEQLPRQRIPGTDQYYDFIPYELTPKFRVGDDALEYIIEKRPL